MTNPVVFSLTYLMSWLLMGLGVFLTFRMVANLRRGVRGGEGRLVAVASPVLALALVVLVVLASAGVFYAGAYTFYNLVLVP